VFGNEGSLKPENKIDSLAASGNGVFRKSEPEPFQPLGDFFPRIGKNGEQKMRMKMSCVAMAFVAVLNTLGAATPGAQWTYKTVDGKELKMDVFLPEGYAEGTQFPIFVVFHGGSWKSGAPDMHYPDCAYWSQRGMIAVSVDYRLKDRDNVEVPIECVKDAKSAIRFLRKNAVELKINPDKLAAAGGAAGGQLAAALAMVPGASDDWDDLSISCVPNAAILYNPWFKCEAELCPPEFVTNGLPPIITFVGSEDPGIPTESLVDFHNDLKRAGNDSEFYVGKGGKHGFCNGRNPRNRFFYWSLDLADQFLVKSGILGGKSLVVYPSGVKPMGPEEFDAYR
jgi:acetyl esterase/lipase